ncbi:somatostatin receptor type 2-like [Saccoglossus kowalevskii]|uniref:Melanopsin-A-like n=1 Tax=Saccoglossus kowalevskii TaxID=10224 RepID=A0ABM0MEZ6_SACKO|nr:PREDICTED: melanopsin-A-like [Saccoglossus kowalevskii]
MATIDNLSTEFPIVEPETSGTGFDIISLVYCFIGIIGIFGNGVVCYIFLTDKHFKSITHRLILHQSCIDLTSSLLFLGLRVSILLTGAVGIPDGAFGNLICKAWYSATLLWGCLNTSCINLCLITLERYFGVCHPILHHRRGTIRLVTIAMIMAWVVGYLSEACWGWMTHWNENGACLFAWINDAHRIYMGIELFFIEFVIPLTIIVYCYIKIWQAVKVAPMTTNTLGVARSKVNGRVRWNIIRMLFVVAVVYFICWIPNVFGVSLWFLTFNQYWVVQGPLHEFTVTMAFINMCVNPIIYAAKYDEFQRACLEKLCCKKAGQVQEISTVQSAMSDIDSHAI